MKGLVRLTVFLLAWIAVVGTANAQELTSGTISGKVVDPAGNSIPGALVIATSRFGTRTAQSDAEGDFILPFLRPAAYSVRVEASGGFSTVIQNQVMVGLNGRTTLAFTLQPGVVESITVTAATPLVDVKSTSSGTNIRYSDFADTIPIGRSFTDTFAVAPGVVGGRGTGEGNYSIGGASGLENAYLIDGVNVTNTGYGGIGSYNIVFGSLGTGVTSEFLDEVQVKTGGFEAEYGQALGGIINTIVKTGTNDVRGSVAWYTSPAALRSSNRLAELDTGIANLTDERMNDFAFSLGGPVIKDKLFYFVAYNPVVTTRTVRAQSVLDPAFQAASAGLPAFDELLSDGFDAPTALAFPSSTRTLDATRRAHNYAAKLTWQASARHQLELTLFGDPADGSGGPQRDINGTTGQALNQQFALGGGASEIDYGSHNQSLKWNAVFTPRFFMEAQIARHDGHFRETSSLNELQYTDLRNTLEFIRGADSYDPGGGPVPLTLDPVTTGRGGVGFISNQDEEDISYQLKFTNVVGRHELRYGVQYDDISYRDNATYTGPSVDLALPVSYTGFGAPVDADGDGFQDVISAPTNGGAVISVLNSAGNPSLAYDTPNRFQVNRASIGPRPDATEAEELNFFLQDTWSVHPRVTIKAGLRWTQEKLQGSGSFTVPFGVENIPGPFGTSSRIFTCTPDGSGGCLESTSFSPSEHTFSDNWAPRIGVSWDVLGNGRSRLWANWGRYYERVPNILAIRAFSNDITVAFQEFTDRDLTSPRFFPFAAPCVDGSGAGGPICQPSFPVFTQGLDQTTVVPGTKLPYEDELSGGFAFEIGPDSALEVRAIFRTQGRVLEDVQLNAVEQIQNFYYGYAFGYPYDPFGGSLTPGSEMSTTFPAAPFGPSFMANPGNGAEPSGGLFDFPEAKREYKALEVVYTKRYSSNWSLFANYRFARLKGNYEGLFRNDNGQSDANFTSLYDFPNSPLMAGQFTPGVLPTDISHVLHVYPSYTFPGSQLRIGGNFSWLSGVPRTSLLAHPIYRNAGEIPGINPVYGYWADTGGVFNPADFRLRRTSDLQSALSDPEALSGAVFLVDYDQVERGNLGRSPDMVSLDLHADYPLQIGRTQLRFFLDVFNAFQSREPAAFVDTVELSAGVTNPDFLKPVLYQAPRSWRIGARWDF
jgi:hypothetical protein